jgi:hypothetical protein
VEEVNVADLIPRTDISGSITESLINELNDKNWKVGHSVSKKQRTISFLAPPVPVLFGSSIQ